MSIHESRNEYYHIAGPNSGCAKRIESEQLQAVEAFKAAGGKIEIVPVGESTYLNDLQKANKQKYGKANRFSRAYRRVG